MNQNILFFLSFFFIYSIPPANAQTVDGSVMGYVVDSQLNEGLAFVNVTVQSTTTEIIKGSYSDEKGFFKITNISEDNFILSIQALGYKTTYIEVVMNLQNSSKDLGIIKLEQSNTALEEVTITAETSSIQQKVDRKVITIGKDLANSGTASDLMIGIPSVNVDVQSGSISLRGNSNVQVMVDGKLSNIPVAQLLKQIPSTAIKSIELITSPSSKYNPEGMSGLINIVLRKNTMLGFNTNINMGISREKSTKFNSALVSNYRNGKVNLYVNYSNNISNNINNGIIQRIENSSLQLFEFTDNSKNNLFKVGIDYYINDKQTLSFFTNKNKSKAKNNGETNAIFTTDAAFDQTQLWEDDSEDNSSQYNLDYKINFDDEAHNMELEIDHNRYSRNGIADFAYPVGNINDYTDLNKTDRERTTINLDYTNSKNKNSKIELGFQANLFNTLIGYESTGEILNESSVLVQSPNTDFDYSRDIYSVYGNYNKKHKKWAYQLGLRLENVEVEAIALQTNPIEDNTSETRFLNRYIELYPSAYITYDASEKNAFQLNYSRRIDRPGIGQVNPIKEWSTPLVSSFGNSRLMPQFTNSLEFNFTRNIKGGSINFGSYYRKISNEINRALFIDRSDVNSGRLIFTHDNFDNSTAYGLEVSSSYKATQWWQLNGSFDLYSQTLKGIAERLNAPIETATLSDIVSETNTVENRVWNLKLYNNFKLSKKITLTAFGFYQGASSNLQYNVKPMYYINIGSRISFDRGRGSVILNYNDIFNSMKLRFDGTKPFVQEGEFNWESNTVFLGLSYRFGSTKHTALSRKRRSNNEASGQGFL